MILDYKLVGYFAEKLLTVTIFLHDIKIAFQTFRKKNGGLFGNSKLYTFLYHSSNMIFELYRLRDRPFLIPGTRAERIWVGYEKFLTIFDGARKIFATISWGAK